MDHIMTYEEYLRDVKKGIVTDLGNSPVTPLLLMLQGKWKTQILYELCIHDTVSAVLYRCEATEVNIPYHYDDGNVHMNHVIRLKNLDQSEPYFLTFEALTACRIGEVRETRRMKKRQNEPGIKY